MCTIYVNLFIADRCNSAKYDYSIGKNYRPTRYPFIISYNCSRKYHIRNLYG